MKVVFKSKRCIAILIFLAFGLMYALAPSDLTYSITLKIVSSFLVIDGLIRLIFADINLMGKKEYIFDIIEGFFAIIIGVVSFKFSNYKYVTFTCGILYIIIPVMRIVVAEKKLNQLLIDSLKYLAMIVLISSINHTFMSNIVISSLFFIIAIVIFITLIKKIMKYKKEIGVEDNE